METVTLVKDYKRRQFSPKAAKIAIDHFGWSELTSPIRPSEVGTRTKPPVIEAPVILKTVPIEKKEPISVKVPDFVPVPAPIINEVIPVKKARKKPVKSKSK